jgi:Kef-type K+ transport system membrane component KefB
MTNHTLILILLEIAVIIGLARLIGLAFVRIRQPPVIGEIVAGIMLGPSLLGLVSPTAFATLFPPATAPFLYLLAQLGLIIFMFLVGLELSPNYLRGKIRIAVITSNVSILLPFMLGAVLAYTVLFSINDAPGTSFTAFTLMSPSCCRPSSRKGSASMSSSAASCWVF